ncbi:pyridoxamine 5'-phosphate oxidase family protein [Mycetohabitans sp. B46]
MGRGAYDRQTLNAILDGAYVRHPAFADERHAYGIPMACWRDGDYLYVHGAHAKLLFRYGAKARAAAVCGRHARAGRAARSRPCSAVPHHVRAPRPWRYGWAVASLYACGSSPACATTCRDGRAGLPAGSRL